MKYFLSILLFMGLLFSCSIEEKARIEDNVPSLQDLSGRWVSPDTADMEASIRNFWSQALCNDDLTSISWLAGAPYSGGYHSGVFKINGSVPLIEEFRWQPYQALRKAKFGPLEIESSTRMPVEKHAVMWELKIKNTGSESYDANIQQDLIAFISKYSEDWQWWYPYPKTDGQTTVRDDEVENVRKFIGKDITEEEIYVTELIDGKPQQKMVKAEWPSDKEILLSSKYTCEIEDKNFFVYDSETDALAAFTILEEDVEIEKFNSGASVHFNRNILADEVYTLQFLMCYGDNKIDVVNQLEHLKKDFDVEFTGIEKEWENRWEEIFKPNNDILSGAFPVLETKDQKARKVYYTGPLTMLYLMHTNLPQHEKVFLTGGPRWGASITFFWDITEWSTLWATVDPEMMKEHLSSWISIDPSKYYGQDNQGGKGVGNGYSANYWALFQMIRAYITVSGDHDFLDTMLEGKSVLEHLLHYATNWKRISIHGKPGAEDDLYKLADFGDDEWNLLECVPTYKHIVPSFNAGYIWMMRETAAFYHLKGDENKAIQLRQEADEMVLRLLGLYAGDGVWFSLYPNGKKIEVRHCLDFMFLGRYMPKDIPEEIKAEMMEFVYRELITDHWMRAQSLQDVAAKDSDRADHGPMGAFDGWPAGTMDALTQLGFPQKALDFYHNIEPVTYEGTWSQAHELYGENKTKKNAKVRIAQRGWHNRDSSSGIAMSQVMLKNLFGFYPGIDGKQIHYHGDHTLTGKLYHVLYDGAYYTLVRENGKTDMIPENNIEE